MNLNGEMLRLAITTVCLIALTACLQDPPSLEAQLARGVTSLARTRGFISVEDTERVLA